MVLLLVSVVPAVVTLAVGTVFLREVVVSTGRAGAWDEVAASGQGLFEEIETLESESTTLQRAAERHRTALAESVRFSRLYAFLGERVLILLPVFALLLMILVGGLALLAANWFSQGFSRPVETLVEWTRSLTSGEPLPPTGPIPRRGELTEFAHLQEALKAASVELAEARRRELEQTRMRSWSEMARKIAHELRNPLTPMAMAAQSVVQSGKPDTSEAGEVLIQEIRRLEELARAFAQFGRPPEGPMSCVDLTEMLGELTRRLSSDRFPIQLDAPEEPVVVRGHLGPLERVFRNLLSNAQEMILVKAESEAGQIASGDPIRIELRASAAGAKVRVSDRGTGIPDKILTRIWEPEFTSKRKGTGLGLAIVRQVVRAHGGSAEAANRPEGGAEFVIMLPYDPDAEALSDPAGVGSS